MSESTSTTETKVYEKGTWQDTLDKSATLFDKSAQGRKRASALLWTGAQVAIAEWIDGSSEKDPHAEVLNADLLDVLGTPRKGDVSKICTVAKAVVNNGLDMDDYPNLSKAYAKATEMTKTVKVHKAEDEAGEVVTAAINEAAPKTATTPEKAALLVLSKGMDEGARLLIDAINGVSEINNEAAQRAFLRAVAEEINGRKTIEAEAAKAATAEKREAEKAKRLAEAEAKKAERVKAAEEKAAKAKEKADAAKEAAKEAAAKAKEVAADKPASKPKPASRPKPAAKPPVEDEPADEPDTDEAGEDDDLDALLGEDDDLLGDDTDEAEVEKATAPATTKPKPVRRGAVKRG